MLVDFKQLLIPISEENIYGSIVASKCILVPFERYGRPKKYAQKSSCNSFSIYISRKN